MARQDLEERLARVEAEVARLKERVEGRPDSTLPWWKEIAGTFADDPYYAEAMRLGREYRESLRPKVKKGQKRRKRSDGSP